MKADVNLELLFGDAHVLGKHIELLKAVKQTGSITKAAQLAGISYKNAWDSLDMINNKSHKPLIMRAQGAKKNSGSQLSEYGEKMIVLYEALLQTQKEFLQKLCQKVDFDELDIENLSRISLNLSARNQLNCQIVQINAGSPNSEVVARLSSGEDLTATITSQSEQNLGLKVGKKVIFIFKAPCVRLSKKQSLKTKNSLKGSVIAIKTGTQSDEITLQISKSQNLTAIISKDEAQSLQIGVGDELIAHIEPTDIIIGV